MRRLYCSAPHRDFLAALLAVPTPGACGSSSTYLTAEAARRADYLSWNVHAGAPATDGRQMAASSAAAAASRSSSRMP